MSLPLEFHVEALAEVECITGDYEAKTPGLGARFRTTVEEGCVAVVLHPLLWRQRSEGYRRVNLPGFPYFIAFVVEEPRLIVVAVAHTSRHPGYLRNRL